MASAADAVLKSNYSDIDGHFFARIAAREQGDSKGYEFHHWVELGLLKSLRSSGDGRSADSAIKVISVDEEYFVIRMMGQQPRQQALKECAGNPCDIYTTYDPKTEKEQTWYFDVTIPTQHLARVLK